MHLRNRITALSALGKLIQTFSEDEINQLARKASGHNSWFTEKNIRLAMARIIQYLKKEHLEEWVQRYHIQEQNPSPGNIGVVFSGNFPAAGFHDLLAVIISGHSLRAKIHPQDPVIIPLLIEELFQIEPGFREYISFEDRLKGVDAIIATESGRSFKYFEQYFSNIPHIIRHKRTSCAILDGTESQEELAALGRDLTLNFGLDPRSVSKLYIPEGFYFPTLFEALEEFSYLKDHHKFVNNYDYNKSVYLINGVSHLDTGFLLFKEDEKIGSPLSVIFYEFYESLKDLEIRIEKQRNKITSVIGKTSLAKQDFGLANYPRLWDYEDEKDLISFLVNL